MYIHLILQCGNGASRTAQGKTAATKALGGGGGAAALVAAENQVIANAEARGATPEAIALPIPKHPAVPQKGGFLLLNAS